MIPKYEYILENCFDFNWSDRFSSENIEKYNNAANEVIAEIFPKDIPCKYRFMDNDSVADIDGYTSEIFWELQRLSVKDGMDIVRFTDGNIGFIAYDGNYINAIEIIVK